MEVLDRFPTQYPRKKAKPAGETPSAAQPDAAGSVTPETPATDTQPVKEHRRSRRHREATENPALAPTPATGGDNAPAP
ncbi:conserved hypothetical protein [Solidesulfovibrio fructosivorans JJ]]|uniref:Uncharacterized protein n=1 Tax=Solidesulfovibrio fructosivorans JJ] TaxID=596151 RepID=E1JSI1_SOLFR|nr:hypothetical protein [Solidesulfovibrio fructosivorans]EFL52950.1 conserved hypothetical protein [Solidesulfovibrio fructosivorans JJ]]